jgi:hypothetical protein
MKFVVKISAFQHLTRLSFLRLKFRRKTSSNDGNTGNTGNADNTA